MLSRFFTRKTGSSSTTPELRGLRRLAEFNPSSANCLLLDDTGGREPDDLGRVRFFRTGDELLVLGRSVFITVPDGIRADKSNRFKGAGEIIRFWFLHQRIPRVLDCRVEEHVRLSTDSIPDLDPISGSGFRLSLLSDVRKQDKRSSLRFSHKPGGASLPVYPQLLFDVFVSRTDAEYPSEGALRPSIEDINTIPFVDTAVEAEEGPFSSEACVGRFKEAMRGNPPEDRIVHVSKPFVDEKHDRVILLELGYSDVLGLGSEEVGRTIFIKKPTISKTKDRRDPHYLRVDDLLLLHYPARSAKTGRYEYFELISEMSKGGLENITIRPRMIERQELGLRLDILDFSMNGFRFEATDEFLGYVLPSDSLGLPIYERLSLLEGAVLHFNFYPRLRFTRETDPYRPHIPRRITVLGQIVRSEIEWDERGDIEHTQGRFRTFGVKFVYDPADFSRDDYRFDHFEMIRAFSENRHFKEVHKSLNGLIAFLESHSREGLD